MRKDMKKFFQKLPPVLRKQILIRFGTAVFGLLTAALFTFWFRDFVLCVPFLLFALVSGSAGAALLIRMLQGGFVRVEGICTQVERTGVRRRAKAIVLSTGEHTVKIYLRGKLESMPGDHITAYLADNMPVYQRDGYEVVNGYLAIDIIKNKVGDH